MAFYIFTISIFLILFAYLGYPLSIYFLGRIVSKKVLKDGSLPDKITLIITAFNEENRIGEKLKNTLNLNYPKDKLQIIVASDGSTDQTNEIVQGYVSQGIELLEVKNRGGKENAQKEAIPLAKGDIIVFSDVATILESNGLKEIAMNFADQTIGCVSSEDCLIDRNGQPAGEGFYVKYEMWLRRLESKANSLVGLSGSFFAARKEVCQDFSGDVQSDFRTLLSSIKLGLRGVCDPKAVGSYLNITDETREFERKVRTVLRGLTVFFKHVEMLNFFKYGLFSYQLFCHKMLRWLVPFFLSTALISNIAIAFYSPIGGVLLLLHFLFYAIAIFGWITQSLKGWLKIPMFFIMVNTAITVAWFQYITGKRVVFWTPSQR